MKHDLLKKIKENYWACHLCMTDAGGRFPEGHVCTVTKGRCKVCFAKDVTLIPWVDYDWKDKNDDLIAKVSRD